MSVIAVATRKGGSGKSTLATHVATYCALGGAAVAIADIDRQQSTRAWLRQRKAHEAGERTSITAWNVDPRSFVRPAVGIDHVVIDTPGGLTGLDLARVVMYADAILVPVGASIFDRESAAAGLAELRTLPRVSSGRCRIGVIGMRLDVAADDAQALRAWAEKLVVPIVTILPQSHVYVRCMDKGLTLFDLPSKDVEADLAHWRPLLQWLQPLARPAAAPGREGDPIAEQPRPFLFGSVVPSPAPVASAAKPQDSGESTTKRRLLSAIPGFLHRRS